MIKMDYALSFNICYCSRILNSRENLQRNSDAFSRFTLLLAPSPDVHSDSPVTAQDSCDMWDRLLRYFATCGQEKPLSGSLKIG